MLMLPRTKPILWNGKNYQKVCNELPISYIILSFMIIDYKEIL